jgi:hypothetical protein
MPFLVRPTYGMVRIVSIICALTLLPQQAVTADGPAEVEETGQEVVFVSLEPVHFTTMLPRRSMQLFIADPHWSRSSPMVGTQAEERVGADLQVPGALIWALVCESSTESRVELQAPEALLTTQSTEGRVQNLPYD